MPHLKRYSLFISHAWSYNDDYYRLVKLLDNHSLFHWHNFSVPEHDPLINPSTHVGKKFLTGELIKQIKPVNCVVIISGIYVAHKYWLQTEIEIAQYFNKPIIGITPQGQVNVPVKVQEAAEKIVAWSSISLVRAIREYSI